MKIKIKNLGGGLPTKGTALSGGWDLKAHRIEEKGNLVTVYTGLALQPEEGYMLRFSPRSSFTKYSWVLQNTPCLGDADYTGEYMFKFRALPLIDNSTGPAYFKAYYEPFPYKIGDKFIQMWAEEVIPLEFVEEEFKQTERVGGFGSTDEIKVGDLVEVINPDTFCESFDDNKFEVTYANRFNKNGDLFIRCKNFKFVHSASKFRKL